MKPEDPICLCFHVTRRKVVNFIRVEKPRRPSQLSECFGAGTGCGWCRPFLKKILLTEIAKQDQDSTQGDVTQSGSSLEAGFIAVSGESETQPSGELSPEEYARLRSNYVRKGGGTPPPGATPIDSDRTSTESQRDERHDE